MDPIIFILALAVLIFIHELGHFITAKKLQMYVEEFSIGFPPRILSKKIKETLYSLNLIPIGGYVKIFGESERDVSDLTKDDPDYNLKKKRAFYNQPGWKKIIVLLAGVSMNFLFGWLIISLVFVRGVSIPGDEVKVINVASKSPAELAGIKEGDIILLVKDEKITSSEKLIDRVEKYADKKVELVLLRDKTQIVVTLEPRGNPPAGQGSMGVVISDFVEKKYSIIEAPWLGLKESIFISGTFYSQMYEGLKNVITHQGPGVEVSGPVGIYNVYSQRQGIFEKLLLTGLISLNLALINILPIPALDGGHLFIVLFEEITGRQISASKKQRLTYAGLITLLALLAFITVKDIIKLF